MCNRWKKNTAQAGEDYKKGIENPRRPWGKATCEAADRYKTGVDKAHRRNAFKKAVKKKGTKGWFIPTIQKGPARFAQGVSSSGEEYRRAFTPYFMAIRGMTLPPRFPRRDPRNIARSSAVSAALGRVKTGKTSTTKVTCPDR